MRPILSYNSYINLVQKFCHPNDTKLCQLLKLCYKITTDLAQKKNQFKKNTKPIG